MRGRSASMKHEAMGCARGSVSHAVEPPPSVRARRFVRCTCCHAVAEYRGRSGHPSTPHGLFRQVKFLKPDKLRRVEVNLSGMPIVFTGISGVS